jgi:predicted ester cyclase
MLARSLGEDAMDNQEIVRNYTDRVWNRHDHTAIDEIVRADFVQHGRGLKTGRDGIHTFYRMIEAAFSNITMTIDDMFGEGDKVVFRWTLQVIHSGPFQGILPTGKTATLTGMTILRLEYGKIVENWVEQDMAGLIQQLRAPTA